MSANNLANMVAPASASNSSSNDGTAATVPSETAGLRAPGAAGSDEPVKGTGKGKGKGKPKFPTFSKTDGEKPARKTKKQLLACNHGPQPKL